MVSAAVQADHVGDEHEPQDGLLSSPVVQKVCA
jgi:hypothetical protein